MEQPSDHFFDREFREKMEGLKAQPSELPWIGVSAALDKMRKERRRKWLLFLSSSGAILLILLALYSSATLNLGDYANSEGLKVADPLPTFFIPSLKGINETFTEETSSLKSSLTGKYQKKTIQSGSAIKVNASRPGNNSNSVSANLHQENPDKEMILPLEAGNFVLSALTIDYLNNLEPEGPGVERKAINLPEFESFSYHTLRIGFAGQLQNTTLASPAFDQYFIQGTGSQRIPKVRMAYGLSAAYDFNNAFGLEVDLLISSSEGQNFKSGSGKSDLSSNYIRIPLMLKYRFLKAGRIHGKAHGWVVKGGMQYGRLNWVNLDASPDQMDPTQFRSNEIGLVADMGYEKYLSPNHIVNAGFRYSYNAPPAGQNEKVRSSAMALYLQIHYALQKRK